MKTSTRIIAALLTGVMLTGTLPAFAADAKDEKAKAYPLDTCVVSGEKLGEMGKPYEFTYKGQTIKMCCKSCKKDFDKEPEKFMKKLQEAEKEKPADKK